MKIEPFWKFSNKGVVSINEGQLVKFLSEIGYSSYYQTCQLTVEPRYLRKENFIVEPIISTRIHSEAIKSIENGIIDIDLLPEDLRKALVSKIIGSKNLTKKEVLSLLPELDKPIITDTPNEARFFYKNGIVKVTGDEISLTNSDLIDGYIWRSQIIDRPFELCTLEELENSEFVKFFKNISGSHVSGIFQHDPERAKSLMSLLGYLLHTYKDCSNPRSVILMDASLSDEPEGRTGKGLLVKALSKFHKVATQDGKSFDKSNRFRFSDVDSDVKILFIDDVPANFDFESFFSLITEGITIEIKYVNKYFIPFERSPKIVISTNYTVTGSGSSHESRKYEYELSNYYSDKLTPKDEFGHFLFSDWDSTQWSYFDNFMMTNVKYYLKNGVYSPISDIIMEYKKFVTSTSRDFAEWIKSRQIKLNTRYNKADLLSEYSCFCEGYPEITPRKLNSYFKSYARYKGLKFDDFHIGSIRYIEFSRPS